MSQKALPHLTLVNEKGEPEEAEENESPLDESLLGKEPHQFDPPGLFAARTLGAPSSDPLPLTLVYSARCGANNSISNLLLGKKIDLPLQGKSIMYPSLGRILLSLLLPSLALNLASCLPL